MADDEQDLEPYQIQWDGEDNPKNWINPKRDGKARATFPNGDSYHGAYKQGIREGQGRYTYAAGGWYDGDWVGGKKHGQGTWRFPDGSVYTGEFVEGRRHGQGTYTYTNGDRYCGSWVRDVRHGPGCYTYAKDGTSFSGEWVEGSCVDGKWSFFDGKMFQANVVNGKVIEYQQA